MQLKFISALIAVRDMEKSKAFYRDVLGQEIEFDFGRNVSFEGGFALHDAVHFADELIKRPGLNAEGMMGKGNMELYFECEDVEGLAGRLKDAGVKFAHPVEEQPWAQRVVRFFDPDGHVVEAGEPMQVVVRRFISEGLSDEDINKRTMMPPEFISGVRSGAIR